MPLALITGASRGFGLALAQVLAERDWNLIVDARGGRELEAAARTIGPAVLAIPGDVADPAHRRDLTTAVARAGGGLDLLVNNASTLGASPLPRLHRYPLGALEKVFKINVLAPLALVQELLPHLSPGGAIVNVTSDASVEAYEGWGGYGASKAPLDQVSAVLGAEQPGLRVYAFDPGDMRTAMHQEAFPGEDISDRPEPERVLPSLLRVLDDSPPSGRYRATDLMVASGKEAG